MGGKYSQLSAEERGAIMAMKIQGKSNREIARALGRASSSISREVARNMRPSVWMPQFGRPPLVYNAVLAGKRARRLRFKPRRLRKLRRDSLLWQHVCGLLALGWSPQQIACTLRRQYPDHPTWHVSHETIYTAIYAMPRGQLKRELIALLRQHKCERRPRGQGANRRGRFADLPSIHDRPLEVEERLVPGHWEGDFIKGRRDRSAVGVLVDRRTLFVILAKMDGSTAREALDGFTRAFAPLPEEARKTLTYDQGKEMALHRLLAEQTGLSIYFADPHSPWQRGICENTNGLIRQYLPKGSDLSLHSQRDLDAIAWRLNTRPRKTLGFHCPAEMFLRELGHPDLAQAIDDALLT